MHVRRTVGDVDLYYLANAKHAENRRLQPVAQDVCLTSTRRDAVPFLLDAWTGAVRPVGLWERDADRVRVRVDLLPGQSTVVALVPLSSSGGAFGASWSAKIRVRGAGPSSSISSACEPVVEHGGGGLPREPWIVAVEHERQTSNHSCPPRGGHQPFGGKRKGRS
jgi:hypothetical protein